MAQTSSRKLDSESLPWRGIYARSEISTVLGLQRESAAWRNGMVHGEILWGDVLTADVVAQATPSQPHTAISHVRQANPTQLQFFSYRLVDKLIGNEFGQVEQVELNMPGSGPVFRCRRWAD